MTDSSLAQGQLLNGLYAPDESTKAVVGCDGVYEIEVGRLAGPMGWYDVAIARRSKSPDLIIPLHMAESIVILGSSS